MIPKYKVIQHGLLRFVRNRKTCEEKRNELVTLASKKVYEQMKTGGESGFNSLFGGERYSRGVFNNLGACAHYWTDTAVNEKEVWLFKLGVYTESATLEKVEPNYGLSVRLFKDK